MTTARRTATAGARRRLTTATLAVLPALALGCRPERSAAVAPAATAEATDKRPSLDPALLELLDAKPRSAGPSAIRFRDVSDATGITFVHCSGNSPDKNYPTANGSGVAMLDFDGDGKLDLYFATTRELPLDAPSHSLGNRLYRNKGDGAFEDVTERAGVGFRGFNHGLAVGDVDGNGHPDLYLANFGRNVLYLNNGDGTFRDAGPGSGVECGLWSSGAAFLDLDNDGDLDLYVTCYGRWAPGDTHPYCGSEEKGVRTYCSPLTITPERHFLFRNRGDGTFEDATERSGAASSEAGHYQAGMGVDAEDLDGDGLPELFATHFREDYNTLYRNLDGRNFQDVSSWAGVVKDSMANVGWGCALADLDNDGWPDILVVNGHVDDNLPLLGQDVPRAEPARVWRNQGDGRFRLVDDPGPFFRDPHVARGAAFGDLDDDGDVDVVVSLMDARPAVLLNESPARPWVRLDLLTGRSNRPAVGATVEVHTSGRVIHRQVKGGGSYLSANDPRPLIGLGSAEEVERIEVRWPNGTRSTLTGPALRQTHRLHEPTPGDPSGGKTR